MSRSSIITISLPDDTGARVSRVRDTRSRGPNEAAVALLKRWLHMARKKLAPIHPGEVLNEEFLAPLGISQYRLAMDISVPARRVNQIVLGTRGITADTALRLARYFGTTDRFWVNLQARYDLEIQRDRLGRRLDQEVAVRSA